MISVHYFEYQYRIAGQTRWRCVRIRYGLTGWRRHAPDRFLEMQDVAFEFMTRLDYELARIDRWVEMSFSFWIGDVAGKGVFSRTELAKAIEHVMRTL